MMLIKNNDPIKAIVAQLDAYMMIREQQIKKSNHYNQNFHKPLISTQDVTLLQLNTLKQQIIDFNDKVNKYIQEDEKNTEFYKAHKKNIINLFVEIDSKYHQDCLSTEDIKHKEVNCSYNKSSKDYWSVIMHCVLQGGYIGGGILGCIGALIGLAGLMVAAGSVVLANPAAGTGLAVFIAIGSMITAVSGAIVGALIGGLIGLVASPFYFNYSELPQGSLGRKFQDGEMFDYKFLNKVYLDLHAKKIKVKEPLLIDNTIPVDSGHTLKVSNKSSFFNNTSSNSEQVAANSAEPSTGAYITNN